MKDIQSLRDTRRINIRKVGVKTIHYPITVLDKEHKTQQTVAKVNMYVNLPHEFKGTHMSRFIEILNCFHGQFNLETFHKILEEMKNRLEAEAAHLEMEFPYFLQVQSSMATLGSERYECKMHGSLKKQLDLVMEVAIPVSLYPENIDGSSDNISTGIWGTVSVAVRLSHFLWIEDLIHLIQQGVQGQSSQGQDSVESMCKRISSVLADNSAFNWYKVAVKNVTRGFTTFASTESPESESLHN